MCTTLKDPICPLSSYLDHKTLKYFDSTERINLSSLPACLHLGLVTREKEQLTQFQ